MTADPVVRAPKRARRPWVVLIVVVLLVALVVAAELIARAMVPSTVRSVVIENLDLPADQQIDVSTPGMMLPQLITGTLDEVELRSEKVTIGGITGSAHVLATKVPVRGGELGSAEGEVSIDQKQFAALLASADLPGAEIVLKEPNVTVQGKMPLFGQDVAVGLTVLPGAEQGDLLLTPVSINVAGNEIDVQALGGFLGDVGEQLAGAQRICIADRLPVGILLTGLRIEGSRAVADITADGRITVDESLLLAGTCPR